MNAESMCLQRATVGPPCREFVGESQPEPFYTLAAVTTNSDPAPFRAANTAWTSRRCRCSLP